MLARERFWPPAGSRARGLARIAPWVEPARAARHLHAHFAAEATDIARVLSSLSGTPFSFTAHATDAFRDPAALRASLAACSFCVTSCEYVRRHLASVSPASVAKLEVLTDAVDLDRFARERPYDPDGPIVAVARLVPKKGLDDLVRAAARAGSREVLIAGAGPERQRLENLIAETRAPVRLLGRMPNREVRALVEGAALFALPCVVAPDGDRDGIPVAIMEAMALEVPVLATREVGIPEAVDADRGRLVAPGDPAALAAAIEELLALDPGEREAMGRAGREWVSQHADRRRQARQLRDWIVATGYHGVSDSEL
jgi:glycosyltransferase involved in cell wall biosynthesis